MPQIRRADVAEWTDVRAVRLLAMADAPDAFGSTYERELSLTQEDWAARFSTSAWFVAEHDDHLVGLVAVLHPAGDTENVSHLVSMWVHPERRGADTATGLVNAGRSWATQQGARALKLSVVEGNDRARRFYEKVGFRPTSNREPLESNPQLMKQEMVCPLNYSPTTE